MQTKYGYDMNYEVEAPGEVASREGCYSEGGSSSSAGNSAFVVVNNFNDSDDGPTSASNNAQESELLYQ